VIATDIGRRETSSRRKRKALDDKFEGHWGPGAKDRRNSLNREKLAMRT
jgi:hypothetical protein